MLLIRYVWQPFIGLRERLARPAPHMLMRWLAARIEDRHRIRRKRLGADGVVGRVPAGRTHQVTGPAYLHAGPLTFPLEVAVVVLEAAHLADGKCRRMLRVQLGVTSWCEASHVQYTLLV